jgi:hypothetical protein
VIILAIAAGIVLGCLLVKRVEERYEEAKERLPILKKIHEDLS